MKSKYIKDKKSRVVVAMSGGVDSSVAAYLLKKQGYDVVGVFLKFWSPPAELFSKPKENTCCDLRSLVKARQIAGQLKIPFYVVNVSSQFKKDIVDHFISEYEAGRTPNPCVLCNRKVKFGLLWEKAKALGAEYLATGHYVRKTSKSRFPMSNKTQKSNNKKFYINWKLPALRSLCEGGEIGNLTFGEYSLVRGKDPIKDQTYFLSSIDPDVIPHLLFPLGNKVKKEVREIAKKAGLPVYSKKDSMGICFIPDGDTARFLDFYTKKLRKPGKIVDKEGNILGRHKGLLGYTIGQKIGDDALSANYARISVGATGSVARNKGRSTGSPLRNPDIPRLYVTNIDTKKNQLTIGENEDCLGDEMVVEKINIINDKFWDLASNGKKMYFQIRGGHKAEGGKISNIKYQISNKIQNSKFKSQNIQITVKFSFPVRAITPGQTVAIYDKNTLLGGGIIK